MSQRIVELGGRPQTTHVRYSVMAFLCVLSFLTYYDRQCIVRAQEGIQQSLSLSDQQMGIVIGVFFFAYALFEIPGGWLGDRIGARFTLTRIVMAWSLFTALTGAATGFVSLVTYRFLFGAGEAGAYPNMARIQSRWLPRPERAFAGGLIWLTARWGAAFAPVIFGTFTRAIDSVKGGLSDSLGISWIATVPSWRVSFFFSGFLGVIWCLAFFPWFRDDPSQKASVSPEELKTIEAGRVPADSMGHHMEAHVWKKLVTSPGLWAMALYYIFGSFGWSFFVSWMPRFLKDVHGVEFAKSEWSSAWPLFFGGISCLAGGYLSDLLVRKTGWRRLGRAIFPVTGCLLAAAAMLGLTQARNENEAVVLMCIAAAAFDFGQAANWASIVDMGGRYAGTATGFINMLGNFGGSAQPYISSLLFTGIGGWTSVFVVYCASFLLAMSMWLFIDPRRNFYDSKDPLELPTEAL